MKTTADRDALVIANVALAVSVANWLWEHTPGVRRLGTLDDVRQEALRALVLTARDFDPSLGWKFSTYATKCVRGRVLAAAKGTGLIRVPHHIFAGKGKPEHREAGRRALACRQATAQGSGPDWLPEGTYEADPGGRMLAEEELAALAGAMRFMPARWQEVLARRFGLGGHEPQTLAEVGDSLGVTKERVRQVEVKALQVLRGKMEGVAA